MRTDRACAVAVGSMLLLAMALTGCGGQPGGADVATANGGGRASAGPSASASVDREQQQLKFVQCMREHGVDMPDPEPDANGVSRLRLGDIKNLDRSKLEAAMDACRSLLPNGGAAASYNPEQSEKLRAYAQCMREHGVNMPDPDPKTGRLPLNSGTLTDIDPDSSEFKAAHQACKQLLPAGMAGLLGGG